MAIKPQDEITTAYCSMCGKQHVLLPGRCQERTASGDLLNMYKTMCRTVDNGKPVEIEIDATAFRPDWTAFWTVAEMVKELSQKLFPFEFKGPGWYITSRVTNDTLLIIPTSRQHEGQQIFLVCVWNHHDAGAAFNWICNAPVRVDER